MEKNRPNIEQNPELHIKNKHKEVIGKSCNVRHSVFVMRKRRANFFLKLNYKIITT